MDKKTVLVKGNAYSQCYAITVTLKPNLYHMTTVLQRNVLQSIVNTICDNGDIKMSLIVELTNNYNIHAHGFVQMRLNKSRKTIMHQITDKFRPFKELGYICIKPIENDEIWILYCLKEFQETKDNIDNENPCIIDKCDVFDWTVHSGIHKCDPCLNEEHWSKGGEEILPCKCNRCT